MSETIKVFEEILEKAKLLDKIKEHAIKRSNHYYTECQNFLSLNDETEDNYRDDIELAKRSYRIYKEIYDITTEYKLKD